MLNMLSNGFVLVFVLCALLSVSKDIYDEVLNILGRKKKYVPKTDEELREKVERKRREFEQFKKYIENCPTDEEIDEAKCVEVSFDWDNIELINRMTVDDIVMNVNDEYLKHGCRVDYRGIAFREARNPFPLF